MLNSIWIHMQIPLFWWAGKEMQPKAAFPSTTGVAVIVELSSRLLWPRDRAGRAHQSKITEQKNNPLLLCYLKRNNSCPTVGGGGGGEGGNMEMKPTQKTVYLTLSMSTKRERKKKRASERENQLKQSLLISHTSDNKSLPRQCH